MKEYRQRPEMKQRQKEYNQRPEAKQHKKEYEQRPEKKQKVRNSKMKWRYGITIKDYDLMLIEQNNKCKICNKEFKKGQNICTDHNHNTGKIRGLLCLNCNTILGLSYENENILNNAIKYLNLKKRILL